MLDKLERHRTLLVIIALISVVFSGTLGFIRYTGDQALAKQQAVSKAKIDKLEKKITEIKAKKLVEQKAKEDAERKAKEDAARKAAADEALRKQLQGQVVTPAICAVSGAHGNPSNIDVVINKKRCFNPVNFVPGDLVSFQGYLVSTKISASLGEMFSAATAANIPLGLTSSYRSYNDQIVTYNNWVKVNGSYAAADTVSARPGYSEHQTGFAVDLSCGGASLDKFTGSSCHVWLTENGAKYGFIQRYKPGFESITGYSAESWHWRYVGQATAQDMKTKAVHTLEQLWGISGGGY